MRKLSNGTRNLDPQNIKRVKKLRSEMSVSERTLWEFIRNKRLGFLFRRQYPIGEWSLDFYCPEAKLCVEIDGEQHALTVERDAYRDSELARLGIHTLRIPSLDLFENTSTKLSNHINEIVRSCEERTGRAVWPNGIHL